MRKTIPAPTTTWKKRNFHFLGRHISRCLNFWNLRLGPPWPRITLFEHSEICSTSQYKRKTQWNIIKNEESNRLWTYSSPTLHFVDQFWVFLFHHFWDPILKFRVNSKSCFVVFGKLQDIPEIIGDDPDEFPETSFLDENFENFGVTMSIYKPASVHLKSIDLSICDVKPN